MVRSRLLPLLYLLFGLAMLSSACLGNDPEPPVSDSPPAATSTSTSIAQPSPTSTSTSTPTPVPTAPSTSSPVRSSPGVRSGCGAALPAGLKLGASVVQTVQSPVQSNGRARDYRLHLPAGYSNSKPVPLVLNFHGLGGNAQEQEAYSGLVPLSDREGFLLISPEGVGRSWSYPVPLNGVDDLQMTRDLLDQVQSRLCIDPNRIYVTGMSNGAFMTSKVACDLADRIAAAAPVAGVSFPLTGCKQPIPILAFHGTADRTVPFAAALVFNILPYEGARAAVAAWAAFNGCSATIATEQISDHVTREAATGCGKTDTQLIVIDGGAHVWPGSPIDSGRPGTTKEISAAEMIWAFFKAHPKS